MRLKDARATGAMWYTGKVCAKHPELEGKRRAKSANCPKCIAERIRDRERAKRAGTYVPKPHGGQRKYTDAAWLAMSDSERKVLRAKRRREARNAALGASASSGGSVT